jgi:hypothetical protein
LSPGLEGAVTKKFSMSLQFIVIAECGSEIQSQRLFQVN